MGSLRFLAVTTFNADGLDLYGRRMLATFEDHWPGQVALRVYSEGWDDEIERAQRLDLLTASDWLAAFKERHRYRKASDYRFDAVRFAHKIAAVLHADETTDAEFLIWIDGDVVSHATITEADLLRFAPSPDQWIAWLDRAKLYPECGFYIINRRFGRHAEAMERLRVMYAGDGLFALAEYHDSFVLQKVVEAAGLPWASLSGAGRTTGHPLINGPLGRFLDHMKGKRKKIGRTPAKERIVKDGAAYWS